MKYIFALIQCIWSTLLLPVSATPLEPMELKQVLSRYQAMSRLEVEFKQTKTLKDMDLHLTSKGHLLVVPPSLVEWKLTSPQKLNVRLEGETISLTSDGETQTFKASDGASPKDRRRLQDLLSWLKLDAALILRHYNAEKIGPRHFRFLAKLKDPAIASLEMKLGQSGYVESLLFNESSGDRIRIEFDQPVVKYGK